ncbi:hypothetical protein ABC195_07845 [Microbacterium sp. 2P01SA-2]|uniref:hypothetical protein n=1 Tax=unclassified Microbacterium TaxID=2609290 RepID=UPI00399F0671
MSSDLLLLTLVVVVIAAVTGTLAVVARDGYRRVPTDATRVPSREAASPSQRPGKRRLSASATDLSEREPRRRDGMPQAVATPTLPR